MPQQTLRHTTNDFYFKLTREITYLKKLAFKFTSESQDINDLVQDTLIKAMRFYHQFKDGTSLKSWLYVIMKHTYINHYRKIVKKREILVSIEEVNAASLHKQLAENLAEHKFAHRDIENSIKKLPYELYLPLKMFSVGYKYHEIAEKIGIPVGTVKTRIYIGRVRLKKHLGKMFALTA